MEEVTDFAFREMVARYSRQVTSDKLQVTRMNNFVMYTEFINVDGLTHPEGRKKLAIDLKYSENQRPMVAQLWGRSPLKFEEAAKIIVDLGFDGIDINMGCPQDKEIGIGACAALIREPELAVEIIKYTKKGAGSLPVSVKTRIGYSKNELGTWLRHLLSAEPAAIAIHARTKQEKSKVPANWEAVGEAVEIRDDFFKLNNHVIARSASDEAISSKNGLPRPSDAFGARNDRTLIIGNGDIKSCQEGLDRVAQTGCDGVMVGRGVFGNPWFFTPISDVVSPFMGCPENRTADKSANYITPSDKIRVMLEHAELFDRELGDIKHFFLMRKHFKSYCNGFPGAHELRAKLMAAKDLAETKILVEQYLQRNELK